MTSLFLKIYSFLRAHRVTYWVLMVVLFVFFGYYAAQIHLEEDLNKLLPSSKNEDGTTKLAFADLKIKDKTFLLFEALDNMPGEERTDSLIRVCDSFVASFQAKLAEKEAIRWWTIFSVRSRSRI